jgi:hypothetical protein
MLEEYTLKKGYVSICIFLPPENPILMVSVNYLKEVKIYL